MIRRIAIVQGKASVFNPCIMLIPGNLYVVQAKPPFKSFASHSRGKARAKGSYVGWGLVRIFPGAFGLRGGGYCLTNKYNGVGRGGRNPARVCRME